MPTTISLPDERWFLATLIDNWPGGAPYRLHAAAAVAAMMCDLERVVEELNRVGVEEARDNQRKAKAHDEAFTAFGTDGTRCMTPPDGGDPTLAEMIGALRDHLHKAEATLKLIEDRTGAEIEHDLSRSEWANHNAAIYEMAKSVDGKRALQNAWARAESAERDVTAHKATIDRLKSENEQLRADLVTAQQTPK